MAITVFVIILLLSRFIVFSGQQPITQIDVNKQSLQDYGTKELIVTFYDKEQKEVATEALWYNLANIYSILVQWIGETPNDIRMFYTPSGTDMGESLQLLMIKVPKDGDNEAIFLLEEVDKTSMHGHLQIELNYGNKRVTNEFNVVNDTEEVVGYGNAEAPDAVDTIFSMVRSHYESRGFAVESLGLLEYSQTGAYVEAELSCEGSSQTMMKYLKLKLVNGVWIIEEAYDEVCYETFISKLQNSYYRIVDIGCEFPVLLVSEHIYEDRGMHASISCDVFYLIDGKVERVGNIASNGTAYPIVFDENGIYSVSGHEMRRFKINDKIGTLEMAEGIFETFDSYGNSTYTRKFGNDAEKITEKEYFDVIEKWGNATVVDFKAVKK